MGVESVYGNIWGKRIYGESEYMGKINGVK